MKSIEITVWSSINKSYDDVKKTLCLNYTPTCNKYVGIFSYLQLLEPQKNHMSPPTIHPQNRISRRQTSPPQTLKQRAMADGFLGEDPINHFFICHLWSTALLKPTMRELTPPIMRTKNVAVRKTPSVNKSLIPTQGRMGEKTNIPWWRS